MAIFFSRLPVLTSHSLTLALPTPTDASRLPSAEKTAILVSRQQIGGRKKNAPTDEHGWRRLTRNSLRPWSQIWTDASVPITRRVESARQKRSMQMFSFAGKNNNN